MYVYIPEYLIALGFGALLGLVLLAIWYPLAMLYHRIKTGRWHWAIY